ncbi:DNA polymerase III subunit delta' [Neptuniibacter sp.]|uniref:DNA polymerase III subunit delta' n=1 Tax=Neptuniibacter sp. TaxID=1962643 RepID=UPI00263818D6|nr:DNA polymerase III subunit delta' [Neptuniibacter sp.]MCP4595781.1 DNA polymerase III subunit delta' [Neptuniibacter sp.]
MSELIAAYPWFTERFQHLAKLHADKRLPHALLINGMSGIGKASFAKSFAQYLLCQSPVNGQSCGQCKSCELNAAGSHPDLFLLSPEEEGKQLKVDQVRALGEFIYSTAQQGGYRVVVIEPADSMNIASANALLKMLEEPGADTLILLVTSKMGQVLPTIKSRCQHVECPNPSETEAINWLMAATDLDQEQARSILHINRGAPKEAQKYIDGGLSEHRAQVIRGLADILKQRRSVIEVAQSLQKLDLELVLGWLYSLLSDVARCAACEDADSLRQDDARNMLTAVAKKTDPVKIFKLADKVHEERRAVMLRQNPNKQLLLECVLLEWAGLLK